MTRGCTIGALSKGSKLMIGVLVVGAAAAGAWFIYKRSKEPGLSPYSTPVRQMATSGVGRQQQVGMETVAFQPSLNSQMRYA